MTRPAFSCRSRPANAARLHSPKQSFDIWRSISSRGVPAVRTWLPFAGAAWERVALLRGRWEDGRLPDCSVACSRCKLGKRLFAGWGGPGPQVWSARVAQQASVGRLFDQLPEIPFAYAKHCEIMGSAVSF